MDRPAIASPASRRVGLALTTAVVLTACDGGRDLSARLLRWYDANRRDLPWRRFPTPYRTLVSEVMLQQTRVDVVVPYFRRFVRRFPSLSALAAAPEQEVLRAWEGLGYYRRARNLRLAAIRVARDGGRLPDTYASLRRLPGLGDYTAAAVAAIAFGRREAAVDGNAARVAARMLGEETHVARTGFRRAAREWLLPLVPPDRPGDFAQAVMELGATVCSPRAPACGRCPVAGLCRSRGRLANAPGAAALRRRPARRARPIRREPALIVIHRGRLLVRRRSREGLLGGMWGLPAGSAASDARRVVEAAGLRLGVRRRLAEVVHDYSHFRSVLTPVVCEATARVRTGSRSAEVPRGWRWLPLSGLDDVPMGRADRRAIAASGYLAPAGDGVSAPPARRLAPGSAASPRARDAGRGARPKYSRKISPSIP
jgi:A/G-specific adenine glycosylase